MMIVASTVACDGSHLFMHSFLFLLLRQTIVRNIRPSPFLPQLVTRECHVIPTSSIVASLNQPFIYSIHAEYMHSVKRRILINALYVHSVRPREIVLNIAKLTREMSHSSSPRKFWKRRTYTNNVKQKCELPIIHRLTKMVHSNFSPFSIIIISRPFRWYRISISILERITMSFSTRWRRQYRICNSL